MGSTTAVDREEMQKIDQQMMMGEAGEYLQES